MKTSTNPALIDYETVKEGLDELYTRRAALEAEAAAMDTLISNVLFLLKTAKRSGVNQDAPYLPKQPEIFM